MSQHIRFYRDLFAALSPKATIITSNRRLAWVLRDDYARQQPAGAVYVTPAIHSLADWLQLTYQRCAHMGLLSPQPILTDIQTQLLWEQAGEQLSQQSLAPAAARCSQAYQAYELLEQWDIHEHHPLLEQHPGSIQLLEWIQRFQQHCHRLDVLPKITLMQTLIEVLRATNTAVCTEESYFFIGFDELTPSLQQLCAALKQQGAHYELMTPPAASPEITCYRYPNPEQEVMQVTQQIAALLSVDPKTAIACFVPNIATIRSLLVRTFREQFPDAEPLPLTLSLGDPLSQHPVTQVLLQCIELSAQPAVLTLGTLIRSPLLVGATTEWTTRACLDAHCRRQEAWSLPLTDVIQFAETREQPYYSPQLVAILLSLQHFLDSTEKLQLSIREWAQHLIQLMVAIGLTAEQCEHKEQKLYRKRLFDLIKEWASSSELFDPMFRDKAIMQFKRYAQATLYQPPSEPGQVQVMGLLEATGLQFDYVFVLGLTDAVWPSKPSPNPFLPLRLQREANLPHSSAQREYDFCQTVTARLWQTAPHISVSYAKQNHDELFSISPLIAHLSVIEKNACDLNGTARWKELLDTQQFETLEDIRAPMINTASPLRGGTNIIKLQAQCPFRAQSEIRLQAKPLETPSIGLSAKFKGTLIHYALESCWQTLQTHAQLIKIDNSEIEALTTIAIRHALTTMRKKYPYSLSARAFRLETARMQRLLTRWLHYERTRKPFKVHALEQPVDCKVGPIQFRGNIDRIDITCDAEWIVIDYKTGTMSLKDWFGERPNDLQLPLYALQLTEPVSALAFAHIRPDNIGFTGLAQDDSILPNSKTTEKINNNNGRTYQETLARWDEQLQQLANDYAAGAAAVDPIDPNKTCQYCHLSSLCRIKQNACDE